MRKLLTNQHPILLAGFILFSSIFSRAASEITAGIRGNKSTVQLYFTDTIEEMLERFKQWEGQLKAKGVESHFFLAAGDLRRALLFNKIEGPGDLEILVHLENQNIRPLRVSSTLSLLREHGIDVEHELKELFGPNKKLDIFVKDQYSFEVGRGYVGEFGEFAEMGDTSINEMRYSPSLNTVDGKDENLEALGQHRILYLEKAKVAKKDKASKIVAVKGTTFYSPMILRMALRALRLETELLLSDNPNRLYLSDDFKDVLSGFELFFGDVPLTEIKSYAMSEVYLEQFKKLFRNRSVQESQLIVNHLKSVYPKTLEIWQSLGLDYEVFTNPPKSSELREKTEFLAVMNNARYQNLRPFLDDSYHIQNPFNNEKLKSKLLELCISARGSQNIEEVPTDLLRLYSPSTYSLVRGFDELDEEKKLAAIEGVIDATKFFAGNGFNRLLKEKSFIDNYVRRFPGIDVKDLDKSSSLSLLELIRASQKDAATHRPQNKNWAKAFNKKSLTTIKDGINSASLTKQTPTIIVDLDRVAFASEARILSVLQDFDAENKSDYFAKVKLSDLLDYSGEDLSYSLLSEKIQDTKLLVKLVSKLSEFIKQNQWREKYLQAELANPDILKLLQNLSERGVQIQYLTARPGFMKMSTMGRLLELGFPKGEGLFNDSDLSVGDYKVDQVKKLLNSKPSTKILAILDDKRLNVSKLRATFPDIPVFQILYQYSRNSISSLTTFFLHSDNEAYEAFRPNTSVYGVSKSSRSCRSSLQKVLE